MGVISGTLNWLTHPMEDETQDYTFWLLGLCFILCVSFLWSTVVKQLLE